MNTERLKAWATHELPDDHFGDELSADILALIADWERLTKRVKYLDRWRVGTKIPRNLYRNDEPIAMLATPELAAEMAQRLNVCPSCIECEEQNDALRTPNSTGCALWKRHARTASNTNLSW